MKNAKNTKNKFKLLLALISLQNKNFNNPDSTINLDLNKKINPQEISIKQEKKQMEEFLKNLKLLFQPQLKEVKKIKDKGMNTFNSKKFQTLLDKIIEAKSKKEVEKEIDYFYIHFEKFLKENLKALEKEKKNREQVYKDFKENFEKVLKAANSEIFPNIKKDIEKTYNYIKQINEEEMKNFTNPNEKEKKKDYKLENIKRKKKDLPEILLKIKEKDYQSIENSFLIDLGDYLEEKKLVSLKNNSLMRGFTKSLKFIHEKETFEETIKELIENKENKIQLSKEVVEERLNYFAVNIFVYLKKSKNKKMNLDQYTKFLENIKNSYEVIHLYEIKKDRLK